MEHTNVIYPGYRPTVKRDIVSYAAKDARCSKRFAADIIEAAIEKIRLDLRDKKEVNIRNFGKFSVDTNGKVHFEPSNHIYELNNFEFMEEEIDEELKQYLSKLF